MLIASSATAKVLSIVSSSLDYAVKLYMNNNDGETLYEQQRWCQGA
jgi:hypothetical protein